MEEFRGKTIAECITEARQLGEAGYIELLSSLGMRVASFESGMAGKDALIAELRGRLSDRDAFIVAVQEHAGWLAAELRRVTDSQHDATAPLRVKIEDLLGRLRVLDEGREVRERCLKCGSPIEELWFGSLEAEEQYRKAGGTGWVCTNRSCERSGITIPGQEEATPSTEAAASPSSPSSGPGKLPWPLGIIREMDRWATASGLGHWSCLRADCEDWWLRRDGRPAILVSRPGAELHADQLRRLDAEFPTGKPIFGAEEE